MANAPTFIAKPLADIPKRVGRPRSFDASAAKAGLEIISQPGQTVTNGESYTDRAEAMKAAASTKRLIAHVAPDAMKIRTRVYETAPGSESYEWVVFADSGEDKKPAKK